MKISDLLISLLHVSEKAAKLAQTIRSEKTLFELLVEEKTGIQKNDRFVQDFKTLADVLIQETIKHDLGKQFPGIEQYVYGEEESKFTNTLGETISVNVQEAMEDTRKLLVKVLDGNQEAASILSSVVHDDVTMETLPDFSTVSEEVNDDPFGIWIDPIDSTGQYIKGLDSVSSIEQIYPRGLQCVTVLIGVFDRKSGIPVIGVINQPFAEKDASDSWKSRVIWGISYKDIKLNSLQATKESPDTITDHKIIISSSEKQTITSAWNKKFTLATASGAGYKALTVIDSYGLAYAVSSGSTYKWDTCAPHAILLSMNGGMVDFTKSLELVKRVHGSVEDYMEELSVFQLDYKVIANDKDEKVGTKQWSNSGGLIAYRDIQVVKDLLSLL